MQGRLEHVRSWLDQAKHFDMEVVFVNDSSVDETLAELNMIVKENKYTFVRNYNGIFGGPGLARNFGMNETKGKWIAFWDSDDEPDVPNFFEMIRLAEHDLQDVAVGGWTAKIVSADGKSQPLEKRHYPKFVDILKSPGIWRWGFKVDIAKKSHFPSILMGEDLVFLANLKLSPHFQYNESVYTYVQGNLGQLTSSKRALQDRKSMGSHVGRGDFEGQFDFLRFMLRLKIRTSSLWFRMRNE
jgi:glycosyltransferase involved in cell wall biosynthesis